MKNEITTDLERALEEKFDAKAQILPDLSIEAYHADHSIVGKSIYIAKRIKHME